LLAADDELDVGGSSGRGSVRCGHLPLGAADVPTWCLSYRQPFADVRPALLCAHRLRRRERWSTAALPTCFSPRCWTATAVPGPRLPSCRRRRMSRIPHSQTSLSGPAGRRRAPTGSPPARGHWSAPPISPPSRWEAAPPCRGAVTRGRAASRTAPACCCGGCAPPRCRPHPRAVRLLAGRDRAAGPRWHKPRPQTSVACLRDLETEVTPHPSR